MTNSSSGFRLRISSRLTLWYGLTLLILLSLFALFSYAYFHTTLHLDFDRHLAHEMRQLIPLVRTEAGRPTFSGLDDLRSVAYQTDGAYGTYVRLLSRDGDVLYRSPNFENHLSLTTQVPRSAKEATASRSWEGEPVRSLYSPIADSAGELRGWLEVTGFEWTLNQELGNLRSSMLVGIFAGVLLAIGGGYLLARRALQPVASLTDAAKQIHATDLATRLPARFGARDELTDLAETFNQMIERLEASFDRERRFTNNAAHEILTPLATIQNTLEVALRRARSSDEYRATIQAVLTEAEEMSDTVRGLLQLARMDRITDLPHEHVDLSKEVEKHLHRFRKRAERERIALEVDVEPAVDVLADAGRLGEVIDNLLDNALKYTPAGGKVKVKLERRHGKASLEVSDTGVGFAPEQAAHLFDRFYRADTPEVQARSGSGLGLAIVEAITRAYGGHVSAHSAGRNRGSRFEVVLPSENGAST